MVTATHRPLPRLSFLLLEVCGFIEIQLTYHKIHPPKVGTSVVCTKFTELCNPFHHPGKPPARWQSLPKVAPRGHAPVPPAACTRPQPPPPTPGPARQARSSLRSTGDKCVLHFKPCGLFGKELHRVEGHIQDKK